MHPCTNDSTPKSKKVTHGFLILQAAALLIPVYFLVAHIIMFHLGYVLHNYIIFLIMLDDKVRIQHNQNQNKIREQNVSCCIMRVIYKKDTSHISRMESDFILG